MAKTYAQLTAEIQALQAKAAALKQKEIAGVIRRMKVAIEFYGITASDLGLGEALASPGRPTKKRAAKPEPRAKGRGAVRYSDGNGHAWSGMGPRPAWLKEALAAGKSLESFALAPVAEGAPAPSAARQGGKLPAKYKDDAGNSWSGRGSTPRWVKAALQNGKTLEQLAV